MHRVITYIDGFNLYFGLKSSKMQRFYWLDVQKLSKNILRKDQTLKHTKYFTARVTKPVDKAKRQSTYIEALETLSDFSIFYGHYLVSPRKCRNCGFIYYANSEKMTDVNIATELMQDAYEDNFDTALLISADSDLTAPVKAVIKLFPQKRVVIAFPPNRHSTQLQTVASAYFKIDHTKFSQSQFPDQVKKANGFILTRPASWK